MFKHPISFAAALVFLTLGVVYYGGTSMTKVLKATALNTFVSSGAIRFSFRYPNFENWRGTEENGHIAWIQSLNDKHPAGVTGTGTGIVRRSIFGMVRASNRDS